MNKVVPKKLLGQAYAVKMFTRVTMGVLWDAAQAAFELVNSELLLDYGCMALLLLLSEQKA